jgi:hypothetical protein
VVMVYRLPGFDAIAGESAPDPAERQ